jgi:hypothetical protein
MLGQRVTQNAKRKVVAKSMNTNCIQYGETLFPNQMASLNTAKLYMKSFGQLISQQPIRRDKSKCGIPTRVEESVTRLHAQKGGGKCDILGCF